MLLDPSVLALKLLQTHKQQARTSAIGPDNQCSMSQLVKLMAVVLIVFSFTTSKAMLSSKPSREIS